MARPGSPDREAHVESGREGGVLGRGVLTAAIRSEDRPGLQMTAVVGHQQGVAYQRRAHVIGHLPADHPAGGQVDHGRQIQPPLARAQVGDVANACLPGCPLVGREPTPDQVGKSLGVGSRDRGALPAAWLDRDQAVFGHELPDQPQRGALALSGQVRLDPPGTRGLIRRLEQLRDPRRQPGTTQCTPAGRLTPRPPRVIAGPLDPKEGAHERDCVGGLLLPHQLILLDQPCVLAK